MDYMVENSGHEMHFLLNFPWLIDINMKLFKRMMSLPEFKKVMKEEKFDIVMIECLTVDVNLGLAGFFNATPIIVSSLEPQGQMHRIFGNPRSLSFVPGPMTGYREPMKFMERFNNFVCTIVFDLIERYTLIQNDIVYKYINN